MISKNKLRIGLIQTGAAVVLLGGVAGAALAGGLPGTGTERPVLVRSDDDGPGDFSGPCDELENAAKPECAGVTPLSPTTGPNGSGSTPVTGATIPSTTGATLTTVDDKGGERDRSTSDDSTSTTAGPAGTGATMTTVDDKGGERDRSTSDDGPMHDLYDDKGGDRDRSSSDDSGYDDSDDDDSDDDDSDDDDSRGRGRGGDDD